MQFSISIPLFILNKEFIYGVRHFHGWHHLQQIEEGGHSWRLIIRDLSPFQHIYVYIYIYSYCLTNRKFHRWDKAKKVYTITLSHWGRVTHICVSKLTIIGSDNGLSPGRRQAIIWTNAWILLIGPLGTNFSDILFLHKLVVWTYHNIHVTPNGIN